MIGTNTAYKVHSLQILIFVLKKKIKISNFNRYFEFSNFSTITFLLKGHSLQYCLVNANSEIKLSVLRQAEIQIRPLCSC